MGPNHCTICGAVTLISSATGMRIHALPPAEPHNVVLSDLRADERDTRGPATEERT